ncbi:hypothetical protein DOY81_015494, partial [Sarcophaga bullata]
RTNSRKNSRDNDNEADNYETYKTTRIQHHSTVLGDSDGGGEHEYEVEDSCSRHSGRFVNESESEFVEEGDSAEDQEARALLNKFLGASIIMKGVESSLPAAAASTSSNRQSKIITTTTTSSNLSDDYDDDNTAKHE